MIRVLLKPLSMFTAILNFVGFSLTPGGSGICSIAQLAISPASGALPRSPRRSEIQNSKFKIQIQIPTLHSDTEASPSVYPYPL
jgi:hypothetical protein